MRGPPPRSTLPGFRTAFFRSPSLGKEIRGSKSHQPPALAPKGQAETHLGVAPQRTLRRVLGSGLHLDLGNRGAAILIGCDLQQLVTEADGIVLGEKRAQLVAKLGVIGHLLLIEEGQYLIGIVPLHSALQGPEDVPYD